jgi:hypothetical protein
MGGVALFRGGPHGALVLIAAATGGYTAAGKAKAAAPGATGREAWP